MALQENFTAKVEALFSRVFGAENASYEAGVLKVFVASEEDHELANYLAHLTGHAPPLTEVASDNFLQFIENADADFDEEEYDDEDEGDDGSTEDESEEESPDDLEEDEADSEDIVNPIESDGRSLRVLTTSDSHKFASKIFHQMLGNEDLSRYPAFMMDLDKFLAVYKCKKAKAGSEIAFFDIEIAKKGSSSRGVFLSAFMKALSTDAGVKIVNAYVKGDSDAFAEGMGDIVASIMENMPESSDEPTDSDTSAEDTAE